MKQSTANLGGNGKENPAGRDQQGGEFREWFRAPCPPATLQEQSAGIIFVYAESIHPCIASLLSGTAVISGDRRGDHGDHRSLSFSGRAAGFLLPFSLSRASSNFARATLASSSVL